MAIGVILLFSLIKDFIYSIAKILLDELDISTSDCVKNLEIAYSLALAKDIPSFKLIVILSHMFSSFLINLCAIFIN